MDFMRLIWIKRIEGRLEEGEEEVLQGMLGRKRDTPGTAKVNPPKMRLESFLKGGTSRRIPGGMGGGRSGKRRMFRTSGAGVE